MRIINKTRSIIISDSYLLCESPLSKFIGLMFSKQKTLIFKFDKEKLIALHMFFVFYPIDILFLNKNKTVVDKKENFRPFTFYKSKKKAMYAIELPAIKKTNTEIGDKIEF